ncbi:MAG: hypothetical protein OEZ11_10465 [Gammaproteobacteria bacterium]|nr:hypothetical protein [Gammaproteobacteria bacterium]
MPDADRDTVVDRLDECPDTAHGVQVDIKGCEIKKEIKLPGVNFESKPLQFVAPSETAIYFLKNK